MTAIASHLEATMNPHCITRTCAAPASKLFKAGQVSAEFGSPGGHFWCSSFKRSYYDNDTSESVMSMFRASARQV